MKTALIIDPFSGASGDMFLGALVDLGVPFDSLRDTLLAIPELAKVKASCEKVQRGVFEATRVTVECPHEHAHRSLSTICAIIHKADLDAPVKAGATRTFSLLAAAEAKVHGEDVEKIHFHEVGALDAIFDIVGFHVALGLLGRPHCVTLPIRLGSGSTRSAHGEIPLPSPATVEMLSGFHVSFSETNAELLTPTGAAIIASTFTPLAPGTMIVPESVGYGAGGRDGDGLPNVLRAIRGRVEDRKGHVCIITSTIDDMNPELYGYVMDTLFAGGALDVYYNPVMMKKNRPGVEVTVIAEENHVYDLANLLMTTTTTLGVRIQREERIELERHKDSVDTTYGLIQVKIATRPDGSQSCSPEYESCKQAAHAAGARIADVYDAARRAWEESR